MKNSYLIAAEDTRKSQILLNEYNIKTKMISYHEHNSHNRIKTIISYLKDGKNPAKKKLSVGRPEDVKAVRKADGPGIELTVISFSMALLINR